MGWENQFWQLWRKNVPLFLDLNLKRDYIFTLNYFLKIKELLYRNDLSGIEKKKLANIDIDRLKAKCFFTAAIGIADFAQILLRIEQVRDTYQMAQLAAEVMEYRKQQGKLPEDLSFLPEVPLSKVDLTPLMYEKTKDGFRIYSHTQDGKIPAAKDSNYSYHVRLREVQ